jgi:hypothetical protein
MKTRNLTAKAILIALTAAGFASLTANAQGLQSMINSNAAFDARMAAINNNNMRQTQMAIQNTRQQHLQQNLPRLQAGYRQYLASGQRGMSFEQFAYWDLMTAAGTNVQGALNAQRAQFAGMQKANATIQSGHASYNAGWADNSARTSAAATRYSNQAIRGNAPYVDPRTGATTQLPYYLPPGQTYNNGGTIYAQDQQGNYYRQNGNYWTPMQAGR